MRLLRRAALAGMSRDAGLKLNKPRDANINLESVSRWLNAMALYAGVGQLRMLHCDGERRWLSRATPLCMSEPSLDCTPEGSLCTPEGTRPAGPRARRAEGRRQKKAERAQAAEAPLFGAWGRRKPRAEGGGRSLRGGHAPGAPGGAPDGGAHCCCPGGAYAMATRECTWSERGVPKGRRGPQGCHAATCCLPVGTRTWVTTIGAATGRRQNSVMDTARTRQGIEQNAGYTTD